MTESTGKRPSPRSLLIFVFILLLFGNAVLLIRLMPHFSEREPAVSRTASPSPAESGPDLLFELAAPVLGDGMPGIEENLPEPVIVSLPPAELPSEPAPAPAGVKERLVLDFNAEDTTGHREVRSTAYQLGVGYRVSDRSMVGLEAQKELHDPQAPSGASTPEEQDVMQVRYKLKF